MNIIELFPTRNQLGEAPIWCQNTHSLYWLDILSRELFIAKFNESNPDYNNPKLFIHKLPLLVTAIDLIDPKNMIMVGLGGIYNYHLEQQSLTLIKSLDNEPSGNRPNDGKLDSFGRFWFGSMNNAEQEFTGTLYCYANNNITAFHDGVGIPNGFGWSPDGQYFYNGDSMRQEIYRYRYDGKSGTIHDPQIFLSLKETNIYPDGLCVDAQGYVWSAQWNGWRVIRYDPDGQIDRVIEMPVGCPSSCIIGGINHDKLFITTARKAYNSEELLKQPQAGGLFMINL